MYGKKNRVLSQAKINKKARGNSHMLIPGTGMSKLPTIREDVEENTGYGGFSIQPAVKIHPSELGNIKSMLRETEKIFPRWRTESDRQKQYAFGDQSESTSRFNDPLAF